MIKRSRKAAYRRRGVLWEASPNDQECVLLVLDASAWPPDGTFRINFVPEFDDQSSSVWSYVSNNIHGMNDSLVLANLGQKIVINDQRRFQKFTSCGLQIELWLRSNTTCKKLCTVFRTTCAKTIKCVKYYDSVEQAKRDWAYNSRLKKYLRTHITLADRFEKIEKRIFLFCKNKNCSKRFDIESKYNAHTLACSNREQNVRVNYKQIRMTSDEVGIGLLKDLGFNHHTQHFLAFDVECCSSVGTGCEKRRHQTLVSISCQNSWGWEPVCFTRQDSNIESGIQLVERFLEYAHDCQRYFQQTFCSSFNHYHEQLDAFGEKSFSQKYEIDRARGVLEHLAKLNVLSFNGEKYDTPVLYPYLSSIFGENKEQINIIKRGTGLMSIATRKLRFGDAVNFVGKMSLAKFSKTFSNQVIPDKGIFPHEKFKCIEMIRQATEFPDYSSFESTLKRPSQSTLQQ